MMDSYTVTPGTYDEMTEEAREKRQSILSPILDQAERVRQARKGRRNPQDVDPDTGEEIPEENGDRQAAS